ncbi:MAG: ribonuclease II [Burkholderiales bacterium 35-55-47]|uniref:ribonuclease catalytic domain-containing protein n=1 Tax=Limnohabitans sp. TaxID=1907725 RepID=UPI000BD27C94|nr:RNB domain-containing ribonuclease [Limnohabitans sp.]OYY18245.1 MAG: ribonuclease II [Burkholderiales bacterium 35-55-47]OYZ72658.1 MAG: ribonuclease II [Burkholderiales bacterium 24-55-52]OZB00113.1 MAG: ribonuclease II [Burkholderiales bacterium 39-55-53]HQR86993.1 RNB domain-containing ribonuclease [Limnohabitans sp.]HQS26909.1 RNB domain-containing ribonuclease [Limnohabitans sp.]
MYALFEEAGKFQTGRILSEAESSAQIELESGKRVKVKAANLLLKFEKPSPADLMRDAQALSATIELDLAWEFAPEDEFGFADLAREYFSAQATLTEQTAALFRLYEAPHYFRRAGKGRFKKASAEVIAQALAGIEKKKQIQAQIESWAAELGQGTCPAPIQTQLYKILFKPDKNAPEYKAVVEAARATQTAPLALLQKAGAINSAYQFHWQRFLFDNFPKGTGFPNLQAPAIADELPLAEVKAYSIDDSQTTEIDDALSVQGLGTGTVTLGIHIAAPALALKPGDAIDHLGRQRLSTVYMPGYKITMLPDDVVQTYTLQEGRDCPAVSLYATFDEATLALQNTETRVERVPIAANLRHDQLDAIVTEVWLNEESFTHAAGVVEPAMPRAQLAFMFRLAQHLKAQREVVRGKPENFNRPDYNFRLVGNDGAEPKGNEQVQISIRQRGAPLDLMVAEAMILANSTWGNWMAELGVPGIYRSQASLLPGVKVRMGTKALPHAGIGVPSYAWSTSPLRRYTDLVNQWQIIACAKHGSTAALAAPFKPKDAELFSIISAFDGAYGAYNAYQNGMERFWTLQYLKQHNITELSATVFKAFPGQPPMARADDLPLVLPVFGGGDLPRGARVQIRLSDVDDISLDISGHLLHMLEVDAPSSAEETEMTDDEDDSAAGPIALAMDVNEAPTTEGTAA